jgi:site-specific DNA-methyltransferase (adenine-specific)
VARVLRLKQPVERSTMTLLIGDCIEQMRTLEADSVDAIVTDPPYGLEFMGKEWDGFGTPLGFQTWSEQWAREALRVLKPGGHLLAFGGTRMYHRLAAGIEDAGFEIRDTLMWLYGSGFPKSLDVSKAIDKAAGAEREVVGKSTRHGGGKMSGASFQVSAQIPDITAPSTEAAKKWQGWGTALKPAVEPIVLARKPLIGTVTANVLTHGTGALNIEASRIASTDGYEKQWDAPISTNISAGSYISDGRKHTVDLSANKPTGRWPANILLDEEAAAMLDAQSGNLTSGANNGGVYNTNEQSPANFTAGMNGKPRTFTTDASTGGASRFFYVAKASQSERNAGLDGFEERVAGVLGGSQSGDLNRSKNPPTRANIHPTVKPVALMKYLIRLVVPKGGVVLDPFLGSGTTAVAAIEEGVEWIGCEREPEYVEIIKARVAAAQPGMGLTMDEQ